MYTYIHIYIYAYIHIHTRYFFFFPFLGIFFLAQRAASYCGETDHIYSQFPHVCQLSFEACMHATIGSGVPAMRIAAYDARTRSTSVYAAEMSFAERRVVYVYMYLPIRWLRGADVLCARLRGADCRTAARIYIYIYI